MYNKSIILLFFIMFNTFPCKHLLSQSYTFYGYTCYGGYLNDVPIDNSKRGSLIASSSDGGYLIAFNTLTNNNGDVGINHGLSDIWLCKINDTGSILWQKCIGGTNNEYVEDIKATNDGGYILTGYTNSNNNGDVSLNHGGYDLWVVKLDVNGNISWSKLLGGSLNDYGYSIAITTDGGYIVAGKTNSNNGDVSGNHSTGSNFDTWVVKLTVTGGISWKKCFGGTDTEWAWDIHQTTDGNYIFIGGTNTNNNGDVSGLHGADDIWVVKINTIGNIIWQKCMGGSLTEDATCILQTNDGGYIFCGTTYSTDGDITYSHGNSEAWVVKLNSIGSITWQHCYGGSSDEFLWCIDQTPDGGYFVNGRTNSVDGDIVGQTGQDDVWALQLSINGTIQWQKCMGRYDFSINPNNVEISTFAIKSSIGGYLIPGISKRMCYGGISNSVFLCWLSPTPAVVPPIEMVHVDGGTFMMGCKNTDTICSGNEKDSREVTLSDFKISKYEVTQGQWMQLMEDSVIYAPYSFFPAFGADIPMQGINWIDGVIFCNRLSEAYGYIPCYYSDSDLDTVFGKSINGWGNYTIDSINQSVYWKKNANGFRLPTEAEWEYASRGGCISQGYRYPGTSNIDSLKYYSNYMDGGDGFDNFPSPVGSFLPNEIGLFDMGGNILEWCFDTYDGYYLLNSFLYHENCNPTYDRPLYEYWVKVLRGGSFDQSYEELRSTYRSESFLWGKRYKTLGLRLCRNE